MTPSTGVSEKGSNVRSGRRMKSGLSRYLISRQKKEENYSCVKTKIVLNTNKTMF